MDTIRKSVSQRATQLFLLLSCRDGGTYGGWSEVGLRMTLLSIHWCDPFSYSLSLISGVMTSSLVACVWLLCHHSVVRDKSANLSEVRLKLRQGCQGHDRAWTPSSKLLAVVGDMSGLIKTNGLDILHNWAQPRPFHLPYLLPLPPLGLALYFAWAL